MTSAQLTPSRRVVPASAALFLLAATATLHAPACATPAAPPPRPAPVDAAVSQPTRLTDFASPLWIRVYERFITTNPHAFASSGPTLAIGDRALGQFMHGPTTLLQYDKGILDRHVPEVFDVPRSMQHSHLTLESIAHMPVWARAPARWGDIKWIHPRIIAWAGSNLVPDPEQAIHGYPARRVYEVMFSGFVRRWALSYLSLRSSGRYEFLKSAYAEATTSADFYGPDWLRSAVGNLDVPGQGDVTTEEAFVPLGFWLRRGIDGTDADLWGVVTRFLALYDAAWWAEIRHRDPAAARHTEG